MNYSTAVNATNTYLKYKNSDIFHNAKTNSTLSIVIDRR